MYLFLKILLVDFFWIFILMCACYFYYFLSLFRNTFMFGFLFLFFFFFKRKPEYEMRISYWSSDVCSSDLIGGGSLPAIRVDLIPFQLNRYGISLEDIRAAIEATNANRPKGAMEGDGKHYQIYTATSGRNLDDYQRLVIAWRNGAPIRRSEEHTSELQSLMRISSSVFC